MVNEEQIIICSKCLKPFDISFYHKNKSKKNGINTQCKFCVSKSNKQYRENNVESVKLYGTLWRKNNKDKKYISCKTWQENNKEKVNKYKKGYKDRNKEKIYLKNKEYRKTDMGKFVQKNYKHKRRAIEKSGDVTTKQLLELQQNAKNCYWCNTSLKNKVVHIDHYVALSKGGKHTLSNLVVACSECNLKKNAKDPFVFAMGLGKLF